MKRLAATLGVALLLTTALALPATAARTTQFSSLVACYTDLGDNTDEWFGYFSIKGGPLPDAVLMTVGANSSRIIVASEPVERNVLYLDGGDTWPNEGREVQVTSQFGQPGDPNFSVDTQPVTTVFPCS